jgi:hypothetical protein
MVAAANLIMAPVLVQYAGAQAAAAVHEAGTVKSTAATGLTLTTAAGKDVTVTVPAGVKVLLVAPGSKDLKSAAEGTLSDVAAGDRVLVIGSAGDAGSLTAARVIVMKAQAIAQTHQAEGAAWAKGGGGIVKSVDPATKKIVLASGMKEITVVTTPSTVVRMYSPGSVSFADAKVSTLGAILPGDQMRVRGARSADGTTITADEIVAGRFQNYSGLIGAVDPSQGTVTLKDLATKKTVTVAVTPSTDLRRIPPMLAQRIAMQMKGAGSGAGPGNGAHAAPAGGAAPEAHADEGQTAAQREGRAGMDLSKMLSRLPSETLRGLKPGDAVMIVASSDSDAGTPTAVTLLAGVEAILTATTKGSHSMTLSPWSVGGGGEAGGGDAGGGEGGGGPQ